MTTNTTAHSTGTAADTTDFPAWALRSHRALPKLDVPRLSEAAPQVMQNLRPFALLLIARPIAAVAAFVFAASQGWWPVAIISTWLVYGSALTAVHHLIHSGLGLSPRTRHFWLSAIACLVAESGHALQVTHLAHHRSDDTLPDPEGYIENVTWAQLPVAAVKFRYRLALWGLRYGPRRGRIRVEMAVHAIAHIASLVLFPTNPWLWIYLTLIHVASVAFAALAGKGPQTNYGRDIESPFIKVHTRLGRILFFSHDLHLEHHAYPKVPLPRLRQLEEAMAPAFNQVDVIHVEMAL